MNKLLSLMACCVSILVAGCPPGPVAGPDANNNGTDSGQQPCSSTCAGCCTQNNFCINPANSVTACGVNGNGCQVCTGGKICKNGNCVNPPCAPDCTGVTCGNPDPVCGTTCTDGGCCTPTCNSTVTCGTSDGCGGTCAPGSGCCNPSCTGVVCGSPDGCGGTCQAGSGCVVPDGNCTPVCSGVTCGLPDQCGGTCQPGSGCNATDGCVPKCTGVICGSSDGCGGTCTAGTGCCTPTCNGVTCGSSDGCGSTCQTGSGCTAACTSPTQPDGGWGSSSAPNGNPCTSAAACGAGYQCLMTSATSGFCFKDCTFDPSGCVGDSICLPVGGGQAWCVRACSTQGAAGTCPSGLGCYPLTSNPGDPGFCFIACTTAASCNPAGTPGVTLKCGTTGATKGGCLCGSDTDCNATGSTVNKCDTASGGCYTPCTNTASCDSVGAGGCCLTTASPAQCEAFTSLDCSQIGCPNGSTCQALDGGSTCVAGNTWAGCTVNVENVNVASGDTQLVAGTPVLYDQQQTITFNVASGAGGWTVLAQGPGTYLGFVKIVDPSGTTVWDWNNQPAPFTASSVTAAAFAPLLNQGTTVYTFPNTGMTTGGVPSVTSGTWTVTLGSDAPAQVSTTVLQKNAVKTTGTVDLDFWVISNTYSSSTLPSAPGWGPKTSSSTVLGALNTAWGHAGISLGTVTYHDGSALASTYSTIDSTQTGICTGLDKLFQDAVAQAGTAQTQTGINFFLVDQITGGGGGILGIDGAIPGPGGANGTPVSGAIAVLDLTSPTDMGHILGHEGAHFLGLFHTTEIPPQGATTTSYDPVADSPGCSVSTMNANQAACPDFQYLMFPTVGGNNTMNVSPQEGTIMRAAPSVY